MKNLKKQISRLTNRERYVTYGVVVLFSWITWSTLSAIQNNYTLQAKIDNLEQDILDLQLDNDRLSFSNDFYATEEYLEFAVRQELNKIAPSENLFVSTKYDDEYNQTADTDNSIEVNSISSNVRDWFDLLFGVSL